jgi:hypothetical protein
MAAKSAAARWPTTPRSSWSVSHPPTPTAAAPAARNAPALLAVIPPVGTRGSSPNGPRIAFNSPGPPTDAGKILTAAAPAFHATDTSVGVKAPGTIGISRSPAHRTTSRSVCGATRNFAPAATAASASATDMTVPAPTTASSPRHLSIDVTASGLSIVISTAVIPERWRTHVRDPTRSGSNPRRTAITRVSVMAAGSSGRLTVQTPPHTSRHQQREPAR